MNEFDKELMSLVAKHTLGATKSEYLNKLTESFGVSLMALMSVCNIQELKFEASHGEMVITLKGEGD